MQKHTYSFEVDATPEEIWAVFHGPKPRVIERGEVRIEILHPGNEIGDGLVRHCHFPVPRYLLSRGRAQSWEWLTELEPPRSGSRNVLSRCGILEAGTEQVRNRNVQN